MINYESLFKISYGLYIVSTGDRNYGNGFISNTVFQVTAEPAKFAACCNKNNYTCSLIDKYGCFSISILSQNANPELFGRFGYKSGLNTNKMEGMDIRYGSTGVPIVSNDCLAFMECKVVEKFDAGTHILFIGELVDAQTLSETGEPITYAYYRQIRKGTAPKNAPTYIDKSKLEAKAATGKKHKCSACGHIHDDAMESLKYADLPEDWKCPVCGSDKEDFFEI
jgi:flavin reductase (DIM6/NTAB) family NADH-FMN oxidoreductase RutF/rubredoxin